MQTLKSLCSSEDIKTNTKDKHGEPPRPPSRCYPRLANSLGSLETGRAGVSWAPANQIRWNRCWCGQGQLPETAHTGWKWAWRGRCLCRLPPLSSCSPTHWAMGPLPPFWNPHPFQCTSNRTTVVFDSGLHTPTTWLCTSLSLAGKLVPFPSLHHFSYLSLHVTAPGRMNLPFAEIQETILHALDHNLH